MPRCIRVTMRHRQVGFRFRTGITRLPCLSPQPSGSGWPRYGSRLNQCGALCCRSRLRCRARADLPLQCVGRVVLDLSGHGLLRSRGRRSRVARGISGAVPFFQLMFQHAELAQDGCSLHWGMAASAGMPRYPGEFCRPSQSTIHPPILATTTLASHLHIRLVSWRFCGVL